MSFKTITVKKRGGGTRKQRVKVLRSGKFKFVKNTGIPKSRRSSKKSKPKRKRKVFKKTVTRVIRKTMPKRRSSSSRKRSFKVPILSNPTFKKAAAGVGAGAVLGFALNLIGQGQLAQNPAVKAIAGFATGDLVGAASAFLIGGGIGSNGNGGGMEGFA